MADVDDFRAQLRRELDGQAESFGRETVERWVEEANRHLREATPPDTASQDEWNMDPIADSVEIRQEGDRWVAEWVWQEDGVNIPDLFEFGAQSHDIEGDPFLAFPGADGETVVRRKVKHPGIPAVGFIRIGRNRIEAQIERGELG